MKGIGKDRVIVFTSIVLPVVIVLTVTAVRSRPNVTGDEAKVQEVTVPAPTSSVPHIPVEDRVLLPIIASAFEHVSRQEVDAAVAVFEAHAWSDDLNVKRALTDTLTRIAKEGGAYYGTELVAVRRTSSRLTTIDTFVWFERGPLLFRVLFYQKDGRWFVKKFDVKTNIDGMIETSPVVYVSQYPGP